MAFINEENIITLDERKVAPTIRIGISAVRGTREEQQDTVFGFSREPYHIAVVCDGMGGLDGGKQASKTAVEILVQDFLALDCGDNIAEFLREEAVKLDQAIFELKTVDGAPLDAGTTIVVLIIYQREAFWMSVGDSKIYLLRNGQIASITREHNYRLSLDILKKRGKISEKDYIAEIEKGEALISYLGMGNLSLIDGNAEAIMLERGDIFLLCSDGLYKSAAEETIFHIVQKYKNVQSTADALTDYVTGHAGNSQDNTSVVLVQYL